MEALHLQDCLKSHPEKKDVGGSVSLLYFGMGVYMNGMFVMASISL